MTKKLLLFLFSAATLTTNTFAQRGFFLTPDSFLLSELNKDTSCEVVREALQAMLHENQTAFVDLWEKDSQAWASALWKKFLAKNFSEQWRVSDAEGLHLLVRRDELSGEGCWMVVTVFRLPVIASVTEKVEEWQRDFSDIEFSTHAFYLVKEGEQWQLSHRGRAFPASMAKLFHSSKNRWPFANVEIMASTSIQDHWMLMELGARIHRAIDGLTGKEKVIAKRYPIGEKTISESDHSARDTFLHFLRAYSRGDVDALQQLASAKDQDRLRERVEKRGGKENMAEGMRLFTSDQWESPIVFATYLDSSLDEPLFIGTTPMSIGMDFLLATPFRFQGEDEGWKTTLAVDGEISRKFSERMQFLFWLWLSEVRSGAVFCQNKR